MEELSDQVFGEIRIVHRDIRTLCFVTRRLGWCSVLPDILLHASVHLMIYYWPSLALPCYCSAQEVLWSSAQGGDRYLCTLGLLTRGPYTC